MAVPGSAVELQQPRPTLGRRDAVAVAALVVVAVAAQAPLLVGGTVLGMDAATQFVPWYAWLGEQLREGRLPGWNPHVLSGQPAAGDPLSGWMYLPAMLSFTALPLAVATPVYLLIHSALAGAGAYVLARRLRMPLPGALVAGLAYELSGYLYLANPCCFAFPAVLAWLPWVLLGVEVAIAASTWRGRVAGWAITGFALSQVLAAWLGQGSFYVLVVFAAWVVYRGFASPDAPARLWARLTAVVGHGAGAGVLGLGLSAAGLLPRLEFNAVSNVAGGYRGAELVPIGGWALRDWLLLLTPGPWYVGATVLALAVVAPLVARRRYGSTFFAVLCPAALALTGQTQTPLHAALLAVPVAGRLHPHLPERVMIVFYLGAALLAGATVAALRAPRRPARAPSLRWLVPVVAVVVVSGDLLAANYVGYRELSTATPRFLLARVELSEYYAVSPAGAYLREQGSGAGGGRYTSYATRIGPRGVRQLIAYLRWLDPLMAGLQVNNRALLSGTANTQGYNPTHIERYDELVTAMNGAEQNYHFAEVQRAGYESPLLDLLNVRWLVVPSVEAEDPNVIRRLRGLHPTVFSGGGVHVLENRQALPRAWLVHDARTVAPGQALELLASGAVDPRRTALLEVPAPSLRAPVDPRGDAAEVITVAEDHIRVQTASDSDALLVLSEIAYPAWQASVDGQPADVLTADHALRAVAVPAGVHTVDLRFRSTALWGGVVVTAVTAGFLVAVGLTALRGKPVPFHLSKRRDKTPHLKKE